MDVDDAIAVVGVAAKVPGASDVDAFWLNLVRGQESVTSLSDEHLRDHGVPDSLLADPEYVKAAALVPDAQYFDAGLFGMTAREAQTCDPQIRLFLEVAHATVENAGYDPTTLSSGVGVFASAGAPLYNDHHLRPRPDIAGFPLSEVMTLNHGGYIATMASYKLDLRGPSMTVQTACSSTLVALHLACQSLRTGDCDAALVGGASIDFPFGHGYRWSAGGVLSRNGHCRPFDEDADGTVFGAGACAVLLKRLPDALADHDHVRAVIRGSAINNDGADKVSFGAPSAAAQSAVVMEAMAVADVAPEDISYVEAHGTGTALGDPIEIAALTDAFNRLADAPLPQGACAVGSVKGNIGHLGPVAGLAAFIKTVLALEHEQLPPSINFHSPNPRLNLPSSPFRVQDRLTAWPRDPARPRRAAVSSMGIGGSNAHVVLEEPPVQPLSNHAEEPRLVVWSGPDAEAELAVRAHLADAFVQQGDQVFADAVATLQHGRQPHAVRAAAVCTGAHDASVSLGTPGSSRIVGARRPVTAARPVWLLFPGQGSQHVLMADGLYRRVPVFARALDEWLERLDSPDLPLRDCWQGVSGLDITGTVFAQPLLFAVEVALAQMWLEAGVRPAGLLGHSVGELAAATVAGVFEPDDAAALVLARAGAMRDYPAGGGMLAAATGQDDVADVLTGTVTVAVVNRSDQVVLSGSDTDLDDVAAELADRGVACTRLPTSGAFHTPLLQDAARAFEKAFAGVSPAPPAIPVHSAAAGRLITADEAMDPSFWANQLIEPVRFAAALDTLLETGPGVLVETGPGQVLTDLARRHARVRDDSVATAPTLPRRGGGAGGDGTDADVTTMLTAAAGLWTAGTDLSWETIGQAPLRHRVPLPGYPYQRQRHWVDLPATAVAPPPSEQVTAAPEPSAARKEMPPTAIPREAPGHDRTSPFSTVRWMPSAGIPPNVVRAGTTAVVFLPADDGRALDVVLALQRAGSHTVRVRPGEAYRHDGDEIVVRPASDADVRRAFDELAARGVEADLLVHAMAVAPWSPSSTANVREQLDDSFFGLLALIQHGVRTGAAGRTPEVVALTAGAVDVSGADPVEPVKASVHGIVRTLAVELPRLRCKVIDLSANTPVDELGDELCRADDHLVVALRGLRRWVPEETPLRVSPGDMSSVVRSGGVYVLTGGLGGLGLATMRRLAATGRRPRIALLGRTIPAAGGPPDTWSAGVATAVRDAVAMGAEVRLLSCDVGDLRQLRRSLDIVTAHYGPVNGLLHLAGVAGDGILQVRDPERAAEVLRPKVLGTLALAEALAGRPALDWLVFFSSRAAVDGLVGSGDYAAANAVMDLCVRLDGFAADRVLSINFPSWTTVGMASRTGGAPAAGELLWATTLSTADTWSLDEHRLDGTPILPGTAHLDMIVRAFGETVPGDVGGALVLSDITFVAPLTARETRHVRVAFVPEGARHRVEVSAQPVNDTAGPWVTHVTGWIERRRLDAPITDPGALRQATEPAADSTAGSFTLGPRWQSAGEVRDGAHHRLVHLRLPSRFAADLDAHPLHPALLDLATSAVRDSPGAGATGDPDGPHLPFLYRRIILFAPLGAELISHIRRQETRAGQIVADVDVIGPDGRVLVAVEGFTMRRIDPAAFGDDRAVAPAPPGEMVGIDPVAGTDMLMTLLSARTPGQVVVRPYRGGRPLPLPAEVDTPPPAAVPAPGPAREAASDAVRLPSPRAAEPVPVPAPAGAPDRRRPVVERLRQLWSRALGIDEIGLDDDFFDLGGNSLTAIELMSQIRATFDVELTVGFLFEAPTLGELTDTVEQRVGQ